jgi:hypothetical protein
MPIPKRPLSDAEKIEQRIIDQFCLDTQDCMYMTDLLKRLRNAIEAEFPGPASG